MHFPEKKLEIDWSNSSESSYHFCELHAFIIHWSTLIYHTAEKLKEFIFFTSQFHLYTIGSELEAMKMKKDNLQQILYYFPSKNSIFKIPFYVQVLVINQAVGFIVLSNFNYSLLIFNKIYHELVNYSLLIFIIFCYKCS